MRKSIGFLASGSPVGTLYAAEVLAHSGLFASRIERENLINAASEYGIILLAGDMQLSDSEREILTNFVAQGGALIGVGGTSGLEKLFGVEGVPSAFEAGYGVWHWTVLAEGYIQIRRKRHPITAGLESSLHTFGGVAVRATDGTSLARMRDAACQPTQNDAIVENRVGKGLAILIAPDLLASIVRIQQGLYVDQDGIPSTDGSAPINDGTLKAEDGLVLNFDFDRKLVDDENRIFYHPIADELREIIVKSIFYAAQRLKQSLAMLWYYPRNLTALGHMSHDSDGNNQELAWELLKVVKGANIRTTWCIMVPGYSAEFYKALKDEGYEIALHYNTGSAPPLQGWGEAQLRGQHNRLTELSGVKTVSNKNHGTRWEGRLDFFRWCEGVGIQCDQSKGTSKRGTIGYQFGGCHPWFPIDNSGRFINCMELNLQTQDLVITCPDYFGHYWVDQAVKHYGVAHVLFHPAHIAKPGVADSLRMVASYGSEKGLEWWTCAKFNEWERARRAVHLQMSEKRGKLTYHFTAKYPLKGATLLFLNSRVEGEKVERYGFEFQKVETDLEGEKEVPTK